MPLEDFEIKEGLGKGSFGSVVKCIRKSDQQVYAMKQIKIQKLKDKDKKNALNEVRFLASIENPFVVSYKQAFYEEKIETLCIVMQFANQGDLQSKIKKHQTAKTKVPEAEIWKTAYHCLEGLGCLHDVNIIHRDIKPANIFFHEGIAKIGDLNVAKHLVDTFTLTQTGTPYYASPEVWSEEPYDYKCDIWSLGCVLYEMATQKPPFRADTPEKLYKRIMLGDYEKVGSPYSKELSAFIAKLMTHNQKKRPCVKELLCESKMMELKDNFDCQHEQDQTLLKTIKFPQNLKLLNHNLPQPKYNISTIKTAKVIPQNGTNNKNTPSTNKIPLPSLKTITSQKNLAVPPAVEKDKRFNIRQIMAAKKGSAISKVASQKLIF